MDDIFTVHRTYSEAQKSHQYFKQYMIDNAIPIQDTKSQVGLQYAKVLGLAVNLKDHTIEPTQQYMEGLHGLSFPQTEKDRRRIRGKLAYIAVREITQPVCFP